MSINPATVKASAMDIAHQAGPCGVGGGKCWKGNFKADFANVVRKGDYAKVDKASATDIAHKRDPAVWVEEKVGKGILKRILRMLLESESLSIFG
ncbi:hypothetical protein T4C_5345 [Trichinella pseudospiralis]|uniref:Uncharacterized protein n=1 Tax=Trichinella pseudospiralis TaxID=6337 RepID=A0A0V1JPL0_TRIPS|nr:hypothetical protein T4C_5345 [Trichinella pseudospiralis]